MNDALSRLPDADLLALAAAVRAGRLAPPFALASARRFCGSGEAGAAALRMQQLTDEGLAPAHLALLLESIAQARARPVEGNLLDLVWTGPEAAGLANRATGVVVRELFASASESVLVVGYAVFQGREVFRALADRMEALPGLRVRMFLEVQHQHGDDTPEQEVLARFARRFRESEWPGKRLPEVFYDPRSLATDTAKRSSLHAKCVVIDRQTALVSSANFTEAAQERNIEVGVLVRSPMFAARLAQHFDTLAAAGLLRPLPISP
jgi:phosphatidylserine/phosphatidylglycerophosphate/cardiolipin synthase-like enzyme